MTKQSTQSSSVTSSDVDGYNSLVSGIYSRKTPSNPVRITQSTGDRTGGNNQLKLKNALLGTQSGSWASKKNSVPDNPLGLQDGLLAGKGVGLDSKKPNFINNPIGYKGGLLINNRRGGK